MSRSASKWDGCGEALAFALRLSQLIMRDILGEGERKRGREHGALGAARGWWKWTHSSGRWRAEGPSLVEPRDTGDAQVRATARRHSGSRELADRADAGHGREQGRDAQLSSVSARNTASQRVAQCSCGSSTPCEPLPAARSLSRPRPGLGSALGSSQCTADRQEVSHRSDCCPPRQHGRTSAQAEDGLGQSVREARCADHG